jgi:O-antigen/teichoic acid export membrane protein
MSRKRTIVKNSLSNIAFIFLQAATHFLLLPLFLNYFGKEIFGINAYILSILLIVNFFSFAFIMSLMKFLPDLIANSELSQIGELLSSIIFSSALLHLLLASFLFIFSYYGLEWFNVPPHLQILTRNVIQLVAIFLLLQFMVPVVDGILSGLEQFHLSNKINLISIASSVIAYLYVINFNRSLISYFFIIQLGVVAQMIIKCYFAVKKLPFKIALFWPRLTNLKKVLKFNLFLIVNQVSDHLMYTTDKLILQKVLGASYVTYYHIAKTSYDLSHKFSSIPLAVIFPSLSAAFATKDMQYIKTMSTSGAVTYNLIVVPPLLSLLILFDDFIRLWVGSGYEITILAGRLFILALIISAPFKIFLHSLVAKGRVKEIGWVRLIYSIANVFISYFLAIKIGLIGVIIPTVFNWLVVLPCLLFYLMYQERFFRIKDFFVSTISYIFVLFGGLFIYFLNQHIYFEISSWPGFILNFACYYIFFILLFISTSPKTIKVELFRNIHELIFTKA